MNLAEFKDSLTGERPPLEATPVLVALWWAKKGNWELAHETAQGIPTKEGAWVHAHLHRVEGDLDNAGYWYGQSGRARSQEPLDQEWDKIATTLLASVPSNARVA
ncbi:hypothetical protein [Flaviflagellibacter deserti]|uniref:Uncharacterized protein n=1 Tax=Flaviflagellibacter deserti TaxID=2267266 RepID=A0ABV9Z4T2_9HYPH